MPAAAVIPAPIAYINVVAVKKLVVGFWACSAGRAARRVVGCSGGNLVKSPLGGLASIGGVISVAFSSLLKTQCALNRACWGFRTFTLKKLECSKQAYFRLNTLAWNNEIGLWYYFVGF